MKKKVRIGDLLAENNIITQEQLTKGLAQQKKTGLKLGRVLVDLGFTTEDKILQVLSKQLSIPVIDLKSYDLKPEVVRKLPERQARRFRVILLEEQENHFFLGMSDPTDLFAVDQLEKILNKRIETAIVRENDVLEEIDLIYRRTEEISNFAGELKDTLGDAEPEFNLLNVSESGDAPVAKLLNSIFRDAVQIRASDIHIEPEEKFLRIRQRVDGMLQEHIIKEKGIAKALVQRLKLLSNLDIAEKRLPQDGRFNFEIDHHTIDVRLSTMPTQHGESVVMRLLDQSSGVLSLNDLGMPHHILSMFRNLMRLPHGMILVTGPTGSGKTTTLYSGLAELNVPEKKIITVEDPVEYRLPRITQVQVNEKIGLSFARVLRTALRQDPDIVMVGEIRDQDTAQIALRAAMTGHLVLSTLHTNDAITSALRLIDMGAEGYLTASALEGIIAQRLVRRICDSCKVPYELSPQEVVWLKANADESIASTQFYTGSGCQHCNQSGYHGRIGVYELLTLNEAMTSALRRNNPDDFAKGAKQLKQFKPLVECALEYAVEGVISLPEVYRVAESANEEIEPADTGT